MRKEEAGCNLIKLEIVVHFKGLERDDDKGEILQPWFHFDSTHSSFGSISFNFTPNLVTNRSNHA